MANTAIERFFSRIEKIPFHTCWEWTGAKSKLGYGYLTAKGFPRLAHRMSFLIHNGYLALDICHKCDNPSCVNPDHLYSGTHMENMNDRDKKGRGVIPRGHTTKLTKEQVAEIRATYKRGLGAILAKKYGISRNQINIIVRNKGWK